MASHNLAAKLALALDATPDPGNGGSLKAVNGITLYQLVTATSETRTIPDPPREGLELRIVLKTDGGDCVVTAASAVNQSGNTVITFDDAGDALMLVSVKVGSGYVWRVAEHDGVTGLAETSMDITALKIGGTSVDATAAELNRAADKSASVITSTATTLSVTVTQHASRTIVLSCATTCTVALPVAAGTGETFTMIVGAASTDGNKVIAANGTDIIQGVAFIGASSDTDTAKCIGFTTSATSDKITLATATTGGAKGDKVVLIDYAANTWHAVVHGFATTNTGGPATPFSAT